MSHPIVLSDEEEEQEGKKEQEDRIVLCTPTPVLSKKRRFDRNHCAIPPTVLIVDDDPTPQKTASATHSFVAETPMSSVAIVKCKTSTGLGSLGAEAGVCRPDPKCAGWSCNPLKKSLTSPQKMASATPSSVAETPMSSVAIVKCTTRIRSLGAEAGVSEPDPKCSGFSRMICLESDNESDGVLRSEKRNELHGADDIGFRDSAYFCENADLIGTSEGDLGSTDLSHDRCTNGVLSCKMVVDCPNKENISMEQMGGEWKHRINMPKCKSKAKAVNKDKATKAVKNQITEEEKTRMLEMKRQKKEEEKMQKAIMKAEAAELKKLHKEKQKWEKGKFALKSIVAEIDAKVVEMGSVGGHLLSRFTEKGLAFRIKSNPVERSILWTMRAPEHLVELCPKETVIPYITLVYNAEDFCNLASSGSLFGLVDAIHTQYPSHTICYLTNRLMAYINKREQEQFKSPASNGWRRPPVEEVLAKLTTHFSRVHSRQCLDEAEVAEHVVGLTCSLASCQYRKKLTWLSVNANGSNIPKGSLDRSLLKSNCWLKALMVIPKVQPRFAIAILKKYPTMKSLLRVYMDPNKSVLEKEFLLKDLTVEGLLGENRRLGEMCSKRVYRILMAHSGSIRTDDVEEGADLFRM